MINLEDDEKLILKEESSLKENGVGRCCYRLQGSSIWQLVYLCLSSDLYQQLKFYFSNNKYSKYSKIKNVLEFLCTCRKFFVVSYNVKIKVNSYIAFFKTQCRFAAKNNCKPCWKTFGLPFTSNYHFLCYKACLLHWNEVSAFVLFCCQIMRRRSPSSKWRIISSTRRIPTLLGDHFILYTTK